MSHAWPASAPHTSPERRAQVERNLRRIHGPDFGGLALRRAVDATFESYARYWAESFRLPGTSAAVLDAGMAHEGIEHLDAALAQGRGAALAIPHLGGWEWAGFWEATVRKHPITVVVEMLDPPEVFEWFADMRRSFGMNVVPLGPDAGPQVVRASRPITSCACCATATSAVEASRSSSSASARVSREDRQRSPLAREPR